MATVAAGTRRLVVGVLVTLTFLLGLAPGPAAAVSLSNTELQNAVDGWAAEIGAPGMSVQVLDSDAVVAEASSGVDGNGEPVDASTPFVWGSVSKQFTAATVVGLERQGALDESTPVVDIVPRARDMLGDPATTVDDLVHHTSGFCRTTSRSPTTGPAAARPSTQSRPSRNRWGRPNVDRSGIRA